MLSIGECPYFLTQINLSIMVSMWEPNSYHSTHACMRTCARARTHTHTHTHTQTTHTCFSFTIILPDLIDWYRTYKQHLVQSNSLAIKHSIRPATLPCISNKMETRQNHHNTQHTTSPQQPLISVKCTNKKYLHYVKYLRVSNQCRLM
jgi:hypothetical protein